MFCASAQRHARGFTIIELLVVVSVVVLLVSLVLPALSKARRTGRAAVCGANLRQIGVMGESYAKDYADAIFAFSWRPRQPNAYTTTDPTLLGLLDQVQFERESNAIQGVVLLRELLGDDTIGVNINWWPNSRHSHLVLADHAGIELPSKIFICPADTTRLRWVNLEAFEAALPSIADATAESLAVARRHRGSSSFYLTAPATQPDIGEYAILPVQQHLYDIGSSNTGFLRLGRRRVTDVAFPSQKVCLFDQQDRHSNRVQMFYAEQEAVQPLLFFDGSVSTRKYRDANKSAVPRLWRSFGPSGGPPRVQISYEPIAALGEAPELRSVSGGGRDVKFWYTHGGLRGVDFGGPNVDTRTWLP
jgi:prepilin-type N-terminal cleavage/methylation domain-containing protein